VYARAAQLIGTRTIRWARADTNGPFHRICHQSARRALRIEVQNRLAVDVVMARRYEERRREELLLNRERLLKGMRRVENRLRQCDLKIAMLAKRT
jgi:hypothetical protein